MNIQDAISELEQLKKTIAYHSNLYYQENRTEISDYEYDMLVNRVKSIENEFPQLITADSSYAKSAGYGVSFF